MVEEQIAARGITDEAVLKALRRVPRDQFVPEVSRRLAYADCPLPIGEGQTISQPYMVALMTQCLKLDKSKSVFEIGTGSGYQTAILAELAKDVIVRDGDVNRLDWMIAKQYNLILNNADISKGLGVTSEKSLNLSLFGPASYHVS